MPKSANQFFFIFGFAHASHVAFYKFLGKFGAAITLKKCVKYAKYDSLRLIVLDRTFLYADNGSISEYSRLWI